MQGGALRCREVQEGVQEDEGRGLGRVLAVGGWGRGDGAGGAADLKGVGSREQQARCVHRGLWQAHLLVVLDLRLDEPGVG